MNEVLKQKIAKVISEWEDQKVDYNMLNNTAPITDLWTVACNMAEIIKELTEREAKLTALVKELSLANNYNKFGLKNLADKAKATLKELGVK